MNQLLGGVRKLVRSDDLKGRAMSGEVLLVLPAFYALQGLIDGLIMSTSSLLRVRGERFNYN